MRCAEPPPPPKKKKKKNPGSAPPQLKTWIRPCIAWAKEILSINSAFIQLGACQSLHGGSHWLRKVGKSPNSAKSKMEKGGCRDHDI